MCFMSSPAIVTPILSPTKSEEGGGIGVVEATAIQRKSEEHSYLGRAVSVLGEGIKSIAQGVIFRVINVAASFFYFGLTVKHFGSGCFSLIVVVPWNFLTKLRTEGLDDAKVAAKMSAIHTREYFR